jgi:hypothetical protein
MILIELTAAIDAAGTVSTFYLSTDQFQTSPTDTPVNTAFVNALIDPGTLGVHAYSDGRTGGGTKLETGEIVIANVDGQFDAWLNYSFDGRAVTIRSGESGAYPSAFPIVLVGTVESIEADWRKIVIRLRDRQFIFDRPVLTTRYAGNNALPSGVEGTASDLKGKVKPKAYGKVYNVSPALVNTSRLEYEMGVCNTVGAANDRGIALTPGAAYTSQVDMETTAPAAGGVRSWVAGGYFRLGSSPTGQITLDVTQGANAAARTVAQILKQLALDAGLGAGEISAADVTALDTANSAEVGTWIDSDSTSFQSAMDQIAASAGAWYGFDSANVLRMGLLTAPSGTPVVTLYDYDVRDGIERRPAKDNGIPVYRATVNHSKIWTTQPSDLAGAVSAATRAYLAEERRSEKAEDTSVKTQWLLATELTVDSLLTAAADSATEAARLLALYKVRRDIFDIPVSLSIVTTSALKLMDVVAVQLSRFGMTSGKSFRLIGIRIELARNEAILTLWG